MDIKTDYRLPPAVNASDAKMPKKVMGEQPVQHNKAAPEDSSDTVALYPKTTEVERDILETAVSNLQDMTQNIQRSLSFSINENTGRTVVEVTDKTTGEVIRQLPTEEALRLAESLDEMRSLLFTAQA